ncbi:S-protein homolog 24-like [Olea europaea var. sylvestris]|uniref:S-protein homolog 24-like n=1 Tax=Olea europaea var. sylvestris TaxID=158386 RepID=UPI000C1D0D66|nr:S-protein homolog 24-like [Olea europaea var. sylvestris]
MKILFCLLILFFRFAQILSSFHFSKGYDVHVVNGIHLSPNPLRIHCASRDDDLGYHTLSENQDFHWHFYEDILLRTLFFCHFWCGKRQKAFVVFKDPTACHIGQGDDDHNQCYWLVKADGFYFAKKNPPSPSDLKKKYDWELSP